ncbi:MAG: hypothetical protein HQ546_05000 [Planctomycetes bacterium]|nr:hypothetical protein [Planctomycetota bacterium]
MSWIKVAMATCLAGCLLADLGCDVPPAPPRTAEGNVVKVLTPAGEAETAAAQKVTDTLAIYQYQLSVLKAYYDRVGSYVKGRWAAEELENTHRAQTFTFDGITAAPTKQEMPLDRVSEAALIESVITARGDYLAAVDDLIDFYHSGAQDFKCELAKSIHKRFDSVRHYSYILSAEVPPADLRPVAVIAEAETLYDEAMRLYKIARPVPIFVDYQKLRVALTKFLQLVREYPTSTRIALSAYYIGELYANYFNEHHRAVAWYQRAWEWDPQISEPARYRAAMVADFQLHHRDRAVQLYRDALKYELSKGMNVEFARQRISILTQRGK